MSELCGFPTVCNRKPGHRGPHGGWQTEARTEAARRELAKRTVPTRLTRKVA